MLLKREDWDFSGLPAGELVPALLWEIRRESGDAEGVILDAQAWLAGKAKQPRTARGSRPGKRRRFDARFSKAEAALLRALSVFDDFIALEECRSVHKWGLKQRRTAGDDAGAQPFHAGRGQTAPARRLESLPASTVVSRAPSGPEKFSGGYWQRKSQPFSKKLGNQSPTLAESGSGAGLTFCAPAIQFSLTPGFSQGLGDPLTRQPFQRLSACGKPLKAVAR